MGHFQDKGSRKKALLVNRVVIIGCAAQMGDYGG